MKSWYDLSKKEAFELEEEFLSHEVAREENRAMHFQIIIGVFVLVFCTVLLSVFIMLATIEWYVFVLLLLGIIVGILLVLLSTIEYHSKFNSWLEIKHKIIKK